MAQLAPTAASEWTCRWRWGWRSCSGASSAAAFDPAGLFGHEVYFDSLTMFVTFLLGARYLELQARHRARTHWKLSLAKLPDTALRLGADGQVQAVSVHRLAPDDQVRVPVGQAFPADGVLLSGQTRADEALLSGEFGTRDQGPRRRARGGQPEFGRTGVDAGAARGRRHAARGHRQHDARRHEPASAAAAPGGSLGRAFLWAVLLAAAAAAPSWSLIDRRGPVWVAVSVLIVTCPCALSLAAPATLVAAARGLARQGVMLRRLDAVETLARIEQCSSTRRAR